MLRIRREQIACLTEAAWTSMEGRMLRHVRKFWPSTCEQRGEEGTQRSVRSAIDRCRELGLVHEYDIGRYVDLAFYFADDFEVLPWAQTVMDKPMQNGRIQLECLWRAAQRETPSRPDRQ